MWSKDAVRNILLNPRYTGFQVWNRQRQDEVLIDVEDVALGHETRMRWNAEAQWVHSEQQTHEAIIDIERFEAAHKRFERQERPPTRRRSRRPYVLSGLLRCGRCGRRMQGSWNHDQAYYRCKFPAEYAVPGDQHPKTVYVREDALVPGLDRWVAQLFDEEHLDGTCAALAEVSGGLAEDDEGRRLDLRRQLRECDAKLARYRALLEHDGSLTSVAGWMAEVEAQRRSIERQLGRKPTARKHTAAEIKAVVRQLKDLAAVLATADPEHKRAVYDELGVDLTHQADGNVHVAAGARVLNERVGGPNRPLRTREHQRSGTLPLAL